MAVHLGLHWISPLISTSEKLVFPYLVLQGGLALIIALMSPVYMIGFGLYAALIGQAVGILRNNIRTTAAAVLMFLALSALSVAYNDGLRAAARGDRSKEIARDLGITERTVKAHLTSIYNKLGVDSRASAVAVAAQRGLLALDELD